jgi:hypothetical protein
LSRSIARSKGCDQGQIAGRKVRLANLEGEEGWDAAIVDLRSKKPVEYLGVYDNYVEGMRLVWSKDSKRVAHFEPDRCGGTTHIYFRNGSKFEEVPFPSGEVPKCHGNLTAEEEEKFVKTIEGTESPKAWLKSGALVIAVDESWITEDGGGSCSQTVTIASDAKRKAFVQSVTEKKVDQDRHKNKAIMDG